MDGQRKDILNTHEICKNISHSNFSFPRLDIRKYDSPTLSWEARINTAKGMLTTINQATSPKAGTVAIAGSAKGALVNVILKGGYFARVTREEMMDLRDNHELEMMEG